METSLPFLIKNEISSNTTSFAISEASENGSNIDLIPESYKDRIELILILLIRAKNIE